MSAHFKPSHGGDLLGELFTQCGCHGAVLTTPDKDELTIYVKCVVAANSD